MTIYKKIILSITVLQFWCTLNVLAQPAYPGHLNAGQSISKNPYTNPVILKHYSPQELQYMEANDSLKLKTIFYYYTQSFIVEKINCTNCLPFIHEEFDVWNYERFRKKSTRYTRVWTKYGFKLTLLSIDELVYKLPTQVINH